ncbi:MAG TPA: DinB family protein [Pyrinomonadaceae bacterium]|nr:DinB family protein [Pyrinomonadaceae bacterium]
MNPPVIWFERVFKLDLPLEMYPNVVERVRGTPARLEDRLAQLPREILTRRDGAKWSMQEQAGHLLDLGTLDIGRLDDYEAGLENLRPADLGNRKTHEADHNADSIERILATFRAERGEFVRRLDAYDADFPARTALHPRLNIPMRLIDLIYFIAEHDDHHLARITDLMRVTSDK